MHYPESPLVESDGQNRGQPKSNIGDSPHWLSSQTNNNFHSCHIQSLNYYQTKKENRKKIGKNPQLIELDVHKGRWNRVRSLCKSLMF